MKFEKMSLLFLIAIVSFNVSQSQPGYSRWGGPEVSACRGPRNPVSRA